MVNSRVVAKSPTQMLRRDHRMIKELFAEYSREGDRIPSAKPRLFKEIKDELILHATIEERLFYPAVRGEASKEGVDDVDVAVVEHHLVRSLLDTMSWLNPGDHRFEAAMKILREQVETHADEEEQYLFPIAKLLPEDVQDSLLDEMEQLRDELRRKSQD